MPRYVPANKICTGLQDKYGLDCRVTRDRNTALSRGVNHGPVLYPLRKTALVRNTFLSRLRKRRRQPDNATARSAHLINTLAGATFRACDSFRGIRFYPAICAGLFGLRQVDGRRCTSRSRDGATILAVRTCGCIYGTATQHFPRPLKAGQTSRRSTSPRRMVRTTPPPRDSRQPRHSPPHLHRPLPVSDGPRRHHPRPRRLHRAQASNGRRQHLPLQTPVSNGRRRQTLRFLHRLPSAASASRDSARFCPSSSASHWSLSCSLG